MCRTTFSPLPRRASASRGPPVTGCDDVEKFLVGFRVAAHSVRPKRGCRGAQEVADAAAELARHLHEQRVIGEAPEVLVKRLVQLVHLRQVLLLGGADHPVHDRLELGKGCGRDSALEPAHRELLEHHAQARHLFEHPRRQDGHPRSPPGRAHHEAFLDQLGQRFAQRDVTDAEPVCEAALDEAVAGSIDPALDIRPQPIRNSVSEAAVGQGLGHVRQSW